MVMESCSNSQPRCWDSSMLLLWAKHMVRFSSCSSSMRLRSASLSWSESIDLSAQDVSGSQDDHSNRTWGSSVEFWMLYCHLLSFEEIGFIQGNTTVTEETSPRVLMSDLFHIMNLGLQHQTVLLQLVDFIWACSPACQLILQHLFGLL